MMEFAVTVGKNESSALLQMAKDWAQELSLPFIERQRGTLPALLEQNQLAGVIVATANGPQVYSTGGSLFFHPGMSVLRVKNIVYGKVDRMVSAMQLTEGMRVLDCT